ncbi:Uncharacterised protein [BD1-7 clade bacterium]|nr:Uncharacterised protein [BD1-7 clade bacterium]
MIYNIKVLKEGDKVLNVWDEKIAILRANGEVDIYGVVFEKGCLPKLSEDVWRISYGNETIDISGGGPQKSMESDDDEDDDFEITIKSPKNRG